MTANDSELDKILSDFDIRLLELRATKRDDDRFQGHSTKRDYQFAKDNDLARKETAQTIEAHTNKAIQQTLDKLLSEMPDKKRPNKTINHSAQGMGTIDSPYATGYNTAHQEITGVIKKIGDEL